MFDLKELLLMKKSEYTLKFAIILLFLLCSSVSSLWSQPNLNWVKPIAGTLGGERMNVHEVDSGKVLLLGRFDGTIDADPGTGTTNFTSAGSNDILMAMYDNTGQFLWGNQFGSTDHDEAFAVQVDKKGNIFITGSFRGSVDFDADTGTTILTSDGNSDIFVAKYTYNGNLLWAKRMGGTNGESGSDIRLDMWNNVYVAGRFSGSVNFDPGGTNYTLTSAGNTDCFMFKLDSLGNFKWAQRLGGTLMDASNRMCVSDSGTIYITGSFNGTVDFDPGSGTFALTSSGSNDIFLGKYNTNGNFIWAFRAGSTEVDNGLAVELHPDGNIILFMTFSLSVDFDPGPSTLILSSSGITDIAIIKYTPDAVPIWVRQLGNQTYDWLNDADISPNGAIYFTGHFEDSLDLDMGSDTHMVYSKGKYDGYINKLDPNGNFVWGKRCGGTSYDYGFFVDAHLSNNVYYSGVFNLNADFDFEPKDTLVSVAQYDAYFGRILNCADTIVIDKVACESYMFDNHLLTASGTYYYTYFTSLSCDSTVQLQITINPYPNNTITKIGTKLVSSANGATYQWIDCDDNYSILIGETAQSFTATKNGNYAVVVTQNGCVDTSECVEITTVDISENNFGNSLQVYPNPTNGEFSIDLGDQFQFVRVTIADITGRIIHTKEYSECQLLNFNLEKPVGIYLLTITSKEKIAIIRLMKE